MQRSPRQLETIGYQQIARRHPPTVGNYRVPATAAAPNSSPLIGEGSIFPKIPYIARYNRSRAL
jgi:hypothetical protein